VPTAQPTLQPIPGQQPTAPQPAIKPTFTFEPRGGAAGAAVVVTGWGFQPNGWVGVYLGVPGPVGTALGSATADAQGRWEARVIIPGSLPDGGPVPAGKVFLVALNERMQAQASAPFGFVPPAGPQPEPPLPPLQQARDHVEVMIVAYGTAPIQRYMGRAMRTAYENGQGFPTLMGFDPLQMQNAPQFGEPALRGRTAQLPVALTFANERRHFLIELAVEEGQWKVTSSSFQRSEPIKPPAPPVDMTPASEPGSLDANALGQLMLEHMRPLRPGQPILTAAVATAGDYALGLARPMGEIDTYFYFKREGGVWRELLVTGPTTRDVLVSNGIPVSLEVPQPMFGVVMGTMGHYNGGPGGQVSGHLVIERIAESHARVTLREATQGDITVYLRLDATYAVLIAGQVFAPEALDQLNIPASIRQ
jgi:hypothetical protein